MPLLRHALADKYQLVVKYGGIHTTIEIEIPSHLVETTWSALP
jgi:hypothetical protein